MRLLVIACACLLISSSGCRKLVSRVAQKAYLSDHAKVQKPSSAKNAEKTGQTSISDYAEGYNKLVRPMENMIDDYMRALPDVKGPPARKPVLVLGTADRDLDEVEKIFKQARQFAPASQADLGKAADEALAAARVVRKAYGDAVHYYTAENYKDDKGEDGKVIDARMRARVEAYEAAVGRLQTRLDAIEMEVLERELKEIPDSKAGYHFRAVNLAAKRLVGARSQPEKLDEALAAVRAAQANLKKYVEAHPDVPGALKSYAGMVDQFESQATAFVREAKEPAKKKKGPPSQNGPLLVTRYNSLAQMGNALHQMEEHGLLK